MHFLLEKKYYERKWWLLLLLFCFVLDRLSVSFSVEGETSYRQIGRHVICHAIVNSCFPSIAIVQFFRHANVKSQEMIENNNKIRVIRVRTIVSCFTKPPAHIYKNGHASIGTQIPTTLSKLDHNHFQLDLHKSVISAVINFCDSYSVEIAIDKTKHFARVHSLLCHLKTHGL